MRTRTIVPDPTFGYGEFGEHATVTEVGDPRPITPEGWDNLKEKCSGPVSKADPHVPEKTQEIEQAVRVLAAMAQIGPNARHALVLIAERMAVGRKRYGEDFDRERDWTKEAQEEFLDGAIYLAIGASK